jgi:CBS domain-containing protein
MAQQVSEVMTPAPVAVQPGQPVRDAAQAMRDYGIGAVLVAQEGQLRGIVTDRDIVVRVIAAGRDPAATPVADVCSADDLVTATPGEDADVAVDRMREHGVRRIPVVEGKRVVGILSLGDMAIERHEYWPLTHISLRPPNS